MSIKRIYVERNKKIINKDLFNVFLFIRLEIYWKNCV